MADQSTLNARDAKLVQWLGEAHAKEAELEADLTAHIALTQKTSYKKRLRQHLTETRDHKRRVASRIKQLGGGSPSTGPNLPGVPEAVGEMAGKAVSAVKGQVGAARAAVTSQPETHLRNAQEELREEHVEIAIYSRILTLAETVGDRETAQLAKAIRRDEERMAKFLDAELGRLVKELARAEIPASLRSTPRRRRTTRRTTGTRSAGASRRTSARSTSKSSGTRSGSGSRTSSSRSRNGSKASGSRSSGGSTSSRSSGGTRTSAARTSSNGRSTGRSRTRGSARSSS
jgi:ferritin-like metal-binding protein YciE